MKYEKPTMHVAAPALVAVQGSTDKSLPLAPDSTPPIDVPTHTACEADE